MALGLTHDEIEDARKRAQPRADQVPVFRRYAQGTQDQTLTMAQRRLLSRLGAKIARTLADNVLALIIATAASRLELQRWAVEDDGVQAMLDTLWLTSRVDGLQFDVHSMALRDGNAGVSLRWKPDPSGTGGRVTLHREPWWDGTAGLFVAYDDYDEPAWAVRDWTELIGGKERQRRVVYEPDAIFRYIREGNGWQPYPLPGDPEWPVPWVTRDGTPLGLPVAHFPNAARDDDGHYGRSDIAGLLALQDDLNSIQHDLTAAAAFTGFQMYTATGVADGERIKVGPGRLLSSDDPKASFGVLAAGDMSKLTEAHAYKRQTMAVDSSTPIHLITGAEWPSGEALLRAEMPLVDKVRKLARVLGPPWVLVAHRATEIANTFGGMALDEDAPITAVFAPPERLDELTELQVQQARVTLYAALTGMTDRTLLLKTGLVTEAEADAIIAAADERAARFLPAEGEF